MSLFSDTRQCWLMGCHGNALPYSAFCIDHYKPCQFNKEEKEKQESFIKKHNIKVKKPST